MSTKASNEFRHINVPPTTHNSAIHTGLCCLFSPAALDTIFIQSGLIVDADEDGDTILGYLDSGLGGDLLRSPYKLELFRLSPICFGHLEPTTFKTIKNPKA
jgi:hypothetical protein